VTGAIAAVLALLISACAATAAVAKPPSMGVPCSKAPAGTAPCAGTGTLGEDTGEEEAGEEEAAEEEADEAEEEASSDTANEESGSQSAPPERGATPSGNAPSSSPRSVPTAEAGAAVVSQLKLSARTRATLRRHTASASTLQFSFTLSTPTTVKVALLRQVGSRGARGGRWRTLPGALTLAAGRGRVSHRLAGRNRLSKGRYLLTVVPAGGRPRSIVIDARR
jgi:hypothetical protein